jgi:putative oxidoreductase
MVKRLFATDESKTLLFQRIVAGGVMLPHGVQKLTNWDVAIGKLTGLGIPTPIAVLVIIIEVFGALGVVLGLGTRIAALGLVAVMLGAIFTVHLEHGFFAPMGIEYHLLYLGLVIPLVFRGGGAYALDHLIARKLPGRAG